MPNLNLRLTEQEHAVLVASARRSRRSLQQEIMAWLFPDGRVPGLESAAGGEPPVGGRGSAAVSSSGEPQPALSPSAGSAARPRHGSGRPSPGSCPAFVPVGVRCKLCGEVHQKKGAVT